MNMNYEKISHTTGIGLIEDHGTRLPIKWSQRWNGSVVTVTQVTTVVKAPLPHRTAVADRLVKKVWRQIDLIWCDFENILIAL